ncbi:MAG: hypothetical protein ACKO5C_04180, partial [Ferruginibacter sp.]
MIRSLLVLTSYFTALVVAGQSFNGQWKGHFQDIATGRPETCEYSLELSISGSTVSGNSFTYFSENNHRYYTICKISGTWQAAKNELTIQETELVKTNLPNHIQNCFQRHTLVYSHESGNDVLKGNWLPAYKNSECGFGNTYLYRKTLQTAFQNQGSPITAKRNRASTNLGAQNIVHTGRHGVAQTNPNPKSSSNGMKTKLTANAPNATLTAKSRSNADATNTSASQHAASTTTTTSIANSHSEPIPYPSSVTKRKSNLISVFDVENTRIVIELYDNG